MARSATAGTALVLYLVVVAVIVLEPSNELPSAAALSTAIELTQGVFLTARTPSVTDVAANVTGALVGVLATALVSGAARRVRGS